MAQTISVFSTKGGVGRTLIATNLAVCLAKKLKDKKVLLLDIDLHLPGDMARMLNLKSDKALVNLASEWKKGKYAASELRNCICHYPKGKIDLLSVILNPREAPLIDYQFISQVLKDLSKDYEFIVVDSGRSFGKLQITLFEQTNLILIVVNPDVLSVYQAKEAIEILQSVYLLPLRMMKAILNRAESQGAVTWREVSMALPCDIIARIPSEGRIVGSALNRRVPVVLDSARSRVSTTLIKLAADLLEHPDFFISHQELETIFSAHPKKPEENLPTPMESVHLGEVTAVAKHISREERMDELKKRVHRRIIQELDLRRLDRFAGDETKIENLRQRTIKSVNNALSQEAGTLISTREERERLVKEITDEALGFGPLEDLIDDAEITDIMVNNKSQIYVERFGRLELASKRFVSNEQVRQIIERIIAPLGRRIDESVPMVDARLSDGSRVNAIIPPLSLTGPTLTIRKFGRERLKIADLTRLNALDNVMSEFLRACVLGRKNIIVSGGTGSGKTTVLNVLSEYVSQGERVLTIEDAAELKLHHQHWVRLESRPPNIEGKGAITVRDLFRNSLRMRPDRIIIGECRGPESLDMLQAMNTGHDGSMTTIHANSTHDVLARLDSLILMSGIEIPIRAIREMIASAIDIIVHTARLSDGSRKILQITEVTGMLDELHIGLQDIFSFHQVSVDEQGNIKGEFRPTGTLPTFFDEIQSRGIPLSKEIFEKKS
ncbi:ATPase, T2SS/T4P/T4SS family [Candidatus Omnitrophota bacterium]